AVIADAWVKGFRGYDKQLAYQAIRKDAVMPPDCDTRKRWGDRHAWTSYEARGGLSYYHSIGYVPADKINESVSRTIEFSLDDYCVSQVAKDLGKTADYQRFLGWSKNYKNLFNKKTGFFSPRLFDGSWDKNTHAGFTEGGPWDYLFGAMQDIPGIIKLMGGKKKFAAMLDKCFAGDHYRLDNEPGHHYSYLYDYCNEPAKTQSLIRKYTQENYLNQPNGINGNDDCGQMSAWYIFSVMGFYPVTPASGIYAIGAPQFPSLTLTYEANGVPKKFEIVANNISAQNKYVQEVTLDGKPLSSPFISHNSILNGHQLVFEMGSQPHQWQSD
ncbi:MAG: glycoside hydrolase family 92 protein, partial [Candidatus Saccharimonadales bacterium]